MENNNFEFSIQMNPHNLTYDVVISKIENWSKIEVKRENFDKLEDESSDINKTLERVRNEFLSNR